MQDPGRSTGDGDRASGLRLLDGHRAASTWLQQRQSLPSRLEGVERGWGRSKHDAVEATTYEVPELNPELLAAVDEFLTQRTARRLLFVGHRREDAGRDGCRGHGD